VAGAWGEPDKAGATGADWATCDAGAGGSWFRCSGVELFVDIMMSRTAMTQSPVPSMDHSPIFSRKRMDYALPLKTVLPHLYRQIVLRLLTFRKARDPRPPFVGCNARSDQPVAPLRRARSERR
jgi:hypothetical protein